MRRREKEKRVLKQQRLARRFLFVAIVGLIGKLSPHVRFKKTRHLIPLFILSFLILSSYIGYVKSSPGPAAVLRVLLPAGTYVGVDPDPWLSEGWLLNVTGTSGAFALRINDTSGAITSYDTHLIVALNNASYNNFVSLSVNSTPISKVSFQYGTPRPYDLWDWPSGDIYPAWFADTYIVGTIEKKTYKNLSISFSISNATDARIHFDAYGSEVPPPPTKVGDITHNSISGDSTILLWPLEEEQYYLTIETDPPGVTTISGEGWYPKSTNVTLTAPTPVPNVTGVQYRFSYWDVDGFSQGTGVNPITVHMDTNHTATAYYIKQYYLTLATSPPDVTTPTGAGWYDDGAYASISTAQYVGIAPNSSQYRFANWTTTDMSEITNASSPSTTVLMDKAKTVTANYVTQYLVTFDHTGLDATALSTVVTVDSETKAYGNLPYSKWVDNGSVVTYSYNSIVSSSVSGKRFSLINVTGPTSPITVTSSLTVTGNYKTQYKVTFDQTGVGTDFLGTVVTVDALGYNVSRLPQDFWWDENSNHSFSFASPLVVNVSKRYVWISTSGLSTLQSGTLTVTTSGNVIGNYATEVKYQVTFDQTGVGSDFPGTIVTIDDANYNVLTLPVSFWWNAGSVHNFTFHSPLLVTPNAKQYVWNSTSGLSSLQNGSITITMSGNVIGHYKTQYYLTVISPYDTPSGEGWYYNSSTAYADLDTGMVDHENGTRRVFTNWSGDASGTNYAQSDPILMDGPKTAIAQWKTQYLVTFNQTGLDGTANSTVVTINGELKNYGDLPNSTWFDDEFLVTYSYHNVSSTVSGKRFVLVNVTGPVSPFAATEPMTIVGNYKTQFYLTLETSPIGITTPSGEDWHDAGTLAPISTTQFIDIVPGSSRYRFDSWTTADMTEITNPTSPSTTVRMDKAKTVTANYLTQYILVIGTQGVPSTYPTNVYLDGLQVGTASDASQYTKWFDAGLSTGTIGVDDTVSGATGTRYVFVEWVEDSSASNPRASEIMNSPKTFTALYKTQYYITVNTDPAGLNPAPIPSSNWYDNSTDVELTAPSESYLGSDEYDFSHWKVDGIEVSGNPITVHMNAPHVATAYYTRVVPALAIPVGGRSIALTQQAPTSHIAAYVTLIALFVAALSLTKRKRK